MESEARYALVGLVVLLLLGVLAGGLYWLRNSGEQLAVQRYTVYFKNQSLEGLQINSDVRMQGIKVGKVLDYTILPKEAKTVKVILEVDARTPVLEGVEAVVSRNLVTGLAAVDLDNVWKGGFPLTEVYEGEDYPLIEEGVPQMARLANNLETLGATSQEAVSRVNTLLSDANQAAFASTLRNLSGLTGDLRRTVPEMNAVLVSARQAAARIDSLGEEATLVVRQGGASLRQASGRLDGLADQTEQTLASTRATLEEVGSGMRDLSARLKMTTDLGLQDLQATTLSLRLASEALQDASRAASDPGRILFGPHKAELGPGE